MGCSNSLISSEHICIDEIEMILSQSPVMIKKSLLPLRHLNGNEGAFFQKSLAHLSRESLPVSD